MALVPVLQAEDALAKDADCALTCLAHARGTDQVNIEGFDKQVKNIIFIRKNHDY